jgi:hypothetical protein
LNFQWLKKLDTTEDSIEEQSSNFDSTMDEPNFIKFQGELFKILESTEAVDSSEGIFINKLVITNAKEEDSGKYLCRKS